MERPPATTRVLDLGSGVRTTILDAARMIAAHYGAPEPQVSGQFRNGDVRSAWADVDAHPRGPRLGADLEFHDGSAAVSDWLKRGGFLG